MREEARLVLVSFGVEDVFLGVGDVKVAAEDDGVADGEEGGDGGEEAFHPDFLLFLSMVAG